MTLQEENNRLKELLWEVFDSPELSSDFVWRADALMLLENESIEAPVSKKTTHKWEGEVCSVCKHSANVHNKGSGFCCAPNCSCDCFVPSGEQLND